MQGIVASPLNEAVTCRVQGIGLDMKQSGWGVLAWYNSTELVMVLFAVLLVAALEYCY